MSSVNSRLITDMRSEKDASSDLRSEARPM